MADVSTSAANTANFMTIRIPAAPLADAGWQSCSGGDLPRADNTAAQPPSISKAARLTIRENTREIANMGLLVPCSTPMAVVRPMTCGGKERATAMLVG